MFFFLDILICETLELFKLNIQPIHSCLPYLIMITLLLERTLLRSKGLIIKRNSGIRNGYDDIILKNVPITIGVNLAKLNTVARDSFRSTKFKSRPKKN